MLHTFLMIIQLFCAVGIIALVLLQRGKGADAGAGFGAGASGTVFGARGATTALSRATAILAAVFMLTSLTLGYLSSHGSAAAAPSSSLLDKLAQPPAAAPTVTPHAIAPTAPPAAGGATTAKPAAPAAPATSATPAVPGATGNAPATGGSTGGAH